MAFAETNRVLVGIAEETTWGTWPASNIEALRFTSENFGSETGTTQSAEIRSDRQIADIVRTSFNANGGFSGELSYGVAAYELLFKHLLGSTAGFTTAPAQLAGEIQAVNTSSKLITDSSGDGVDLSGISVGDWVRTTGFSNAANNGYFQVTAVNTTTASAHEITLDTDALVDEAAGAVATQAVQGSAALRNGTKKYSLSAEKQFLDLNAGNGFAMRFLGMRVGGIGFELSPNTQATISPTMQGKQVSDTIGSDLSDNTASLDFTNLSTVNSAATNDVMNTVDGVGALILNRASPITASFQSLSLNAQNALRRQEGLTPGLGSLGIGVGSFTTTGSATIYFEDMAVLTEHLLFRDTDLAVTIKDGSNNAYLIDLPRIRLGGNALPTAGGRDQDASIPVDLTAIRSTRASQDYTFAIHKFVAPT